MMIAFYQPMSSPSRLDLLENVQLKIDILIRMVLAQKQDKLNYDVLLLLLSTLIALKDTREEKGEDNLSIFFLNLIINNSTYCTTRVMITSARVQHLRRSQQRQKKTRWKFSFDLICRYEQVMCAIASSIALTSYYRLSLGKKRVL